LGDTQPGCARVEQPPTPQPYCCGARWW